MLKRTGRFWGIVFISSILVLFSVLILSACNGEEDIESTAPTTFILCEHKTSDWITDREPTLDNVGALHRECIHCGFILEVKSIPSLSLTQEELINVLSPSLVMVYSYYNEEKTVWAQGSGFFIDSHGTFITNAHVIEDCLYITATDHSGKTYYVDALLAYNNSEYYDYAICRITGYSSIPVEFSGNASPGDTVYAIGFPEGMPTPVITKGKITDLNYRNFIISDTYIAHGNSGGVLVNDKGKVLGITTAISKENYCMSLKNLMFSDEFNKEQSDVKSPLEYFHPTGIPEETTTKEYKFENRLSSRRLCDLQHPNSIDLAATTTEERNCI